MARSRSILEAVVDRARVLDGTAERYDHPRLVPARSFPVLVDVEVGAEIVEVDRRPEPEELDRHRRAARGLADGADAPRAVARAPEALGRDADRLAADDERPLDGHVLREPRRVHEDAAVDTAMKARLLEDRRARGEEQVAADLPRVRLDDHAQPLKRLHDLDANRPDDGLHAVRGCAP